MRWQIMCAISILFMAPSIQAADTDLKAHVLRSGKVIYPKPAQEHSAPTSSHEKRYFIGYETRSDLADPKACREEAEEYWEELRPAIEKVPGVTQVLMQPERPVPGLTGGPVIGFRQFQIHKNPDGSWTWDPGTAVAPGQR